MVSKSKQVDFSFIIASFLLSTQKKRAFFESSLNFIIYYFVIGSSNGLAGKSPELYRFTSGSASQAYLTN